MLTPSILDFFKLIIYMAFFLLVMAFYSFPLNIIRDVYMTARSFYLKARQLMRYRAATKNMEQRYPNATETEITELSDKTCIICREEMSLAAADDPRPGGPNVTPKKLPCGHIFHFHCLRSWLERQQSCPTWYVTTDTHAHSLIDISCSRRNVLETTLAVPPPANPAPRLQPAAGQANGNRDDFFRQLVELPPLVPGQIAQGPPPNQERQSTPTPTSTQPSSSQQREPLRPPPQFRGFNGRDGEWHTWDQGEHSSMNTPQAAEEPLVDTSGEGDLSSSDSPTDLTSETPRESAREAAARAALRRFQSGSSTAHERAVRRPDPLDQASRSLSPRNSAENTNGLTNVASSSDFSIEAQPTAHISSGPSQRSASAVPRLIPLFDPFVNNQLPTRTISSLPPSITPEQLARLDVVSREAIDERLRILDGVQAALWRSAEELLKLKSVLPSPQLPMPSNTTRQPQHGHLPNVDTEEERRNEQ
jgi:E3 ubiquitin-protein ligase synoviolin